MKGKAGLWLAAALGILALLLSLGSEPAQTQEGRMADVLSAIEGAGRVEVALFTTDDVPTGAVVVAEGAANAGVKLQLIRAVRTLLGLPEAAVDVFVMEEGYR